MTADPARLLREGQPAAALAAVDRLRGGPVPPARLALWTGLARRALGEGDAALAALREAVRLDPAHAPAWRALGQLLTDAGAAEAGLPLLAQGAGLHPQDADLQTILGMAQLYANRPEAAARSLDRAAALRPGDPAAAWRAARVLPVVAASTDQAARFRARYRDRLTALAAALAGAPPAVLRAALDGAWDAFHLHYQGLPAVDEQRLLGGLLHRIAGGLRPALAGPRPVPPPGPDGRLRIGFASSLLCRHTVSVLFGGWLRGLDRRRYSVHLYHLGDRQDAVSDELSAVADTVRVLPGAPFDAAATAIAGDALHALVYPELGMDRRVLRLAALRLAPVQAVAWGHPVTTGLPTVDLFLSSVAMEPPDGDAHYTERLVRLPGLGVHLARPGPAPGHRRRAELGLAEDALVFLVPQSPFKLRPADDDLYARIAAAEPRARFVFVMAAKAQASRGVKDTIIARLHAAFAARGLVLADHLRILPQLSPADFLELNRLSDVFLDAPGWSGGRTTTEALSCGLVPVTLPGPLMRQRHTAALLRLVGVDETIARDRDDYVALALRLARDRAWRAALQARIAQGLGALWEREDAVRALEGVLEAAIADRAAGG